MSGARIILFAKAPLPGHAKTRLVPALGEAGAAALAERMLRHALSEAVAACIGPACIGPVELCVAPGPGDSVWPRFALSGANVEWSDQGAGDLGDRLARAAGRALAQGPAVLLIGSDCPALDAAHLRAAAAALDHADTVMIPAIDGGYVLLGLRRSDPSLFSAIAWSTACVAAETANRIAALGWRLTRLEPLHDIDEPGDLAWLPEQLRPAPVSLERQPRQT